jgi:ABC-2 type transport system ATP-binding protein
MLLDEPTTGLDPRSKKDVQEFIRRIREAHDSSILLCTHDMDEAEELCDRVGIMVDGRVLALEKPEKLKLRYASEANGRVPTLEETFMAATGYSVEEASAEGED